MNRTDKELIAIGEALIDFIPLQTGKPIRDVKGFEPAVGGAPANVCGAFVKLGGKAEMITQLGEDPFGDKIVEQFKDDGIGCNHVLRTSKANTSLAFVALSEDGKREFSFYRNPGADMLFESSDIKEEWFDCAYALHFCSVSLGDFPMKEAHKKAIEFAKKKGAIVSFDPNLRPALWDDKEAMISAVKEFARNVDIIKISDEELEALTGTKDVENGANQLLQQNVKLVIYTEGSDGARAYTKKNIARAPGYQVNAVDTTGAGDGFIGSFLHCLYEDGVEADQLSHLSEKKLVEYLIFSNQFSSISVTKKGAIQSYPTKDEMITRS